MPNTSSADAVDQNGHFTKTALVTGGARRIGKRITQTLHEAGYNVLVHYNTSADQAHELVVSLNQRRPNSASSFAADLNDIEFVAPLVAECIAQFGRLDVLVNNASTFYPTPITHASLAQWDDLLGSNLKAPFFLTQACVPHLREQKGSVVNIVDIYARRPLADHAIYCAAKAGLEMLTRALARDLAPQIRVNGIAPGAILWPENDDHPLQLDTVLKSIPLGRLGTPEEIAQTVLFFVSNASYITGQTLAVDGGRSVVN